MQHHANIGRESILDELSQDVAWARTAQATVRPIRST